MKNLSLMLVASALVLSSCTLAGTALGVGATAGVAMTQEGGIGRAVDDGRIQLEINNLWIRYSVEAFSKLDMTVNHGRVLITGVVQNPEHRVEAVRLAWQPEGVQQVINEVRVAESTGIMGYAKDTWITTRLRSGMTFDRDIESVNYSIDTVQGTVYLMGYANSQKELNRVVELARTISGVQNVVSYVRVYEAQDGHAAMSQEPSSSSSQAPMVIAPSAQYDYQDGYQDSYGQGQMQNNDQMNAPYIVRDPVQADNLRARDMQMQRVEETQGNYKQGIDREVIQ
jgi:osmotically-inducible protein OsmY